MAFQSPLHRGSPFNLNLLRGHAVVLHFSPLFIGEVPSTEKYGCQWKGGYPFQSPLHRGSPFNAQDRLGKRKKLYFSPLFIGEVPSTSSLTAWESLLSISVPSSSGKSLQFSPCGDSSTSTRYFSPLFIGEVPSMPSLMVGSK